MNRLLKLYKEKNLDEGITKTGLELIGLCLANNCSIIASFAEDCICDEFIKRTAKKLDKYYNNISQFYIDDGVKFNGRRKVNSLLDGLLKRFDIVYPISKQKECKQAGLLLIKGV